MICLEQSELVRLTSLYRLVKECEAYVIANPSPEMHGPANLYAVEEFKAGSVFVLTQVPVFHPRYNDELLVEMLYKGQVNMFSFYNFPGCHDNMDKFERTWEAHFVRVA